MSNPPDQPSRDSLGRERLPSERYSQHGGDSAPKFIAWTCKACSRVYPAQSRSARYDSKCRGCGARNTIKFVGETGSWIQGRTRVTKFLYYPTFLMAREVAIKSNKSWMARQVKIQYRHSGFSPAELHNKTQGSIDHHGIHHPIREFEEK